MAAYFRARDEQEPVLRDDSDGCRGYVDRRHRSRSGSLRRSTDFGISRDHQNDHGRSRDLADNSRTCSYHADAEPVHVAPRRRARCCRIKVCPPGRVPAGPSHVVCLRWACGGLGMSARDRVQAGAGGSEYLRCERDFIVQIDTPAMSATRQAAAAARAVSFRPFAVARAEEHRHLALEAGHHDLDRVVLCPP
jgi:hypothetical protein